MKELTSCSKKSSLFLSTLSALCESCFPYCSESSVQAGFCFVFPDTSYFHSHLGVHLLIKRELLVCSV